jgi:hypothetical protein
MSRRGEGRREMRIMENTYTYTARSADNPEEVVTFTLHDHSLSVGVGAPLEHVDRALHAASDETQEDPAEVIKPLLKPVVVSALERTTEPFNLADVNVNAEYGGLRVAAWVRAGGLRLAPVTFSIDRVDNADAAEAFMREVEARKVSALSPGKLPGPLDYWATWLVAGATTMAVLAMWLGRRYRQSAA